MREYVLAWVRPIRPSRRADLIARLKRDPKSFIRLFHRARQSESRRDRNVARAAYRSEM
jgi:hypothetical protein